MLNRLRIRQGRIWYLEHRVAELERDKVELITAIRLTQEFVMLPAVDGWSWYDTLKRHDPQLLDAMLNPPKVELDSAGQVPIGPQWWHALAKDRPHVDEGDLCTHGVDDPSKWICRAGKVVYQS